MCVPGTYEKVAEVGRRDFLKLAGAAALGSLAAGVSAVTTQAQTAARLSVSFAASVDGQVVTYSITLRNDGDVEVRDLYIAGKVPEGASFQAVVATPPGAWFRGFEAAGTPLQSAVWLAERVPAKGALGPFRYQVVAGAAGLAAHAWVSWDRPQRGEAMSETAMQATRGAAFPFANTVDLTHPLSPATPVFPVYKPMEMAPLFTIDNGGFYVNQVTMPEHIGTHMDAPVHFAKGGMTVDQLPLTNLIAPAVVMDISSRAASNPDSQLTLNDVRAWETRYGRIPAGAAVLLYSGWETRIGNAAAFLGTDAKGGLHFPGFHKETIDFLLQERDVKGIGLDTPSLDYGPSQDFIVHSTWLPTGRWGLENLAHLGRIPAVGAMVLAAPIKIANGSGGPTRVIAMW